MSSLYQPEVSMTVQPDRDSTKDSKEKYLERCSKLKRAQKEIAKDENALRDLIVQRKGIERRLHNQRLTAEMQRWYMEAELAKCSAQILKPILLDLQKWLPLELRELIYSYLVADCLPTVVPKAASSLWDNSLEVASESRQAHQDLNPFRPNYMFNTRVMGKDIAYEAREYLLRKTPVYFSGTHTTTDLARFLKVQTQPGRYVRDLIRYLRVYLRCERLAGQLSTLGDGVAPSWLNEKDKRIYNERRIYETYSASLKGLQNLPYDKHHIKIEICILHTLFGNEEYSMRRKTNLLEAIKSTYFHIKKAGAEVTVRSEYVPDGSGYDVTWELDLDADEWEKRTGPVYDFDGQVESPSRRVWLEKTAATRLSRVPPPESMNISWQHGLYYGRFTACVCATCTSDPICAMGFESGDLCSFGDIVDDLEDFDFDFFLGNREDGFQVASDFDFDFNFGQNSPSYSPS